MAKTARAKIVRPDRKSADRPAARAPEVSAPVSRSLPPPTPPDAGAVRLFQEAVEALQRRQFHEAIEQFEALLKRFPGERALLDRVRMYVDLAKRELSRGPVNPRTLEERVTAATAALNNGQDHMAELLARSALNESPEHDLALYLMAVVEARRGNQAAALALLTRSIAASPEVRAQARHDPDFESLRQSESFQQLMESPASRKARRAR